MLSRLQEIERDVVSQDGQRAPYIELGSGRPLVVSTAFGIPFAYWRSTLQRLTSAFRVLFPKQRGLWGGLVANGCGVAEHASDLVALMESLDLRDVALLGHCSGVTPLLHALPRIAQRVSQVCCVSARYQAGPAIEVERLIGRASESPTMFRRIVAIAVGYAPPALRPELVRELDQPSRLAAQLHAIASARAHHCPLPPQGLPTELIIAENDTTELRESARIYAERAAMTTLRLRDVSDAGHFFLQEQPERAARLLRDVFRAVQGGRSP